MLLTISPTPAPETLETTSTGGLTTAIIGMVGVLLGTLLSGVISWKLHRQEARESRRRIAMEKLAGPCSKAATILRYWRSIPEETCSDHNGLRSRREQWGDAFMDASVWVNRPNELQEDFNSIYEHMGELTGDAWSTYRGKAIGSLLMLPSRGQDVFHKRIQAASARAHGTDENQPDAKPPRGLLKRFSRA